MLNTLGNITVDPHAGLLFLEFGTGLHSSDNRRGRGDLGQGGSFQVSGCESGREILD